jgi:hypothetical protein
MATLKGQNLRIIQLNEGLTQATCYAQSTNCTVTLTTNTESGVTKDDVGNASMPIKTTNSWSVQVESLYVLDTAAILKAIKERTRLNVCWDETTGTKNSQMTGKNFGRSGFAYITDATFTWNDREMSVKSVQLTGDGALLPVIGDVTPATLPPTTFTKGQFVRLFLATATNGPAASVIGAAKNMSLHVSVAVEEASTKDTEGEWAIQEPGELSYDISSSALVRSGERISSNVQAVDMGAMETMWAAEGQNIYKFAIANVSGANNRTIGTHIVDGDVLITSMTINAQVSQNATYDVTLTGYGEYTVPPT